MRSAARAALGPAAIGWLIVLLAPLPARAGEWQVEKAGFDLYRISGQNVFIRTEGCEDAPASGAVDVQKDGGTQRLTFSGSSARCTVRDFLVPARVLSNQYNVLLTQDQASNWYRVTDGDVYLKTVGCFSRTMSEPAVLDLNRDGTGWIRFASGRQCAVEHAFQRFNPR